MMAITFDTLKYANRLKSAGVPERQAEAEAGALAETLSEALDTTLATKSDVNEVKKELRVDLDKTEKSLRFDINRLEKELLVVKWVSGATFAAVMSLVLKAFFVL